MLGNNDLGSAAAQVGHRIYRETRQRAGQVVEVKPAEFRQFLRFHDTRFTIDLRGPVDHRDPVLAFIGKYLFGDTEKIDRPDRQAGFFLGLAPGSLLGLFEMIDLAADNVPMSGLRRTGAAVQKQFAIPKDGKARSDARMFSSRHGLLYGGAGQHESRDVVAETDRSRAVILLLVAAAAVEVQIRTRKQRQSNG